jgi:osmoprotectant transport system permease protein
VETLANAVLGITQVTPALALFGLLIPLFAALVAAVPALRDLGIRAIGPAPALIGVAAYLALPLLRGLVSGLRSADPAAVEAARAMGFTEGRITREVRVPLALPVLIGALRVAAVQSVGLVTLGGLIGAGGLGAIVFEGMAQFAGDLILLGALPVVVLALLTDAALAAAVARLEGRRR